MNDQHDLIAALRRARALLALPGNDFSWSGWEDAPAALAEVDQQISTLEHGKLPPLIKLKVLFAATGPIQEVSLSSGWSDEFLTVAAAFDSAIEHVSAAPPAGESSGA